MALKMDVLKQVRISSENFHGIDEAYPVDERKFYPFHFHQTFRLQAWNGRTNKTKSIKPLICSYCGEDISENGNGEYYSGLVVFECPNTVKVCCCKKELPIGSMDFHDQKFGFKYPIVLPKYMINDFPKFIVYDIIVKYRRFEYNKYKGKEFKVQYFEKNLFNSYAGGANSRYAYMFKTKGLTYARKFSGDYTLLTKQEVADIITEILNNQPNYQLSIF